MSISEVEAQLREVLTRCQAQLFLWCADWTAVALGGSAALHLGQCCDLPQVLLMPTLPRSLPSWGSRKQCRTCRHRLVREKWQLQWQPKAMAAFMMSLPRESSTAASLGFGFLDS